MAHGPFAARRLLAQRPDDRLAERRFLDPDDLDPGGSRPGQETWLEQAERALGWLSMKARLKRYGCQTWALSGGCSSNALGSREKFQSQNRRHSDRRSSATASSLRVMWKGVRTQPFVVFTSISRGSPSGAD